MGYKGFAFESYLKEKFNILLKIVHRARSYFWVPEEVTDVPLYLKKKGYSVEPGFQVQSKRWIVERTFAWLNKYRRLSKDYEFNTSYSEGLIYLAMMKNMMRKIVKFKV